MRRFLISACVAIVLLPCGARASAGVPKGAVRVTFLDVTRNTGEPGAGDTTDDAYMRRLERHWGQGGIGDAAVVETAEKCVLIDGGLWTKGRAVVLPYLKRRGVTRLDAVILTHQHGDHYGGLTEVIEAMPVGEVVTNGLTHTAKAYRKFMEAVKSSGARYRVVRGGEALDWGEGVTAMVVQAAGGRGIAPDDYNNNSLVLRMTCGKTAILFAGDMEDDEEAELLASRRDVRSQVLKAGHHGSSSSSSFPFLRAVRPEIAVISVGEGNRFRLPHQSVIDRLESMGCAVYRTDLDGTVTVTSDGTRVAVETERKRPREIAPRKPLKEEFYRLESEAQGLMRRKEYAGAAACYRKALAVEPGAASAYSKLGYCCKKMRREDEAVTAFTAALEREPCDPYANLHLGLIFLKSDKKRALGYLEKYLDCQPDSRWSRLAEEKAGYIHGSLGWELKKAGRDDEAIAEFEKSIAISRGNAFSHLQLGLLYPSRDLGRARKELEKYLELEPKGKYAPAARDALAELEWDR